MKKRLSAEDARAISENIGLVPKAVNKILSDIEEAANKGAFYINVSEFGFDGPIKDIHRLIMHELKCLGYICKIITCEQEYDYMEVRW